MLDREGVSSPTELSLVGIRQSYVQRSLACGLLASPTVITVGDANIEATLELLQAELA